MQNKTEGLIPVKCLKHLVCVMFYIIQTPVRLAFAAIFSVFLSLVFIVGLTCMLYEWSCQDGSFKELDNIHTTNIFKDVYWKFLIKNNWVCMKRYL